MPSGRGDDRAPRIRPRVELTKIPRAESGPLQRIVVEPPPQFGTGPDLLQPRCRLQFFFGKARGHKRSTRNRVPSVPRSPAACGRGVTR